MIILPEKMTDPTTEFFAELARRGHEPLLEKATGTIRFDLVQGKRRSHWLVVVDKGDVTVSRRNTRADSTIRADKALFDRLAEGHANAMAETLRGTVAIDGDPELLIFFQRLFPGPPLEGGKG